MHPQIEKDDIIERYARHQLAPEEQRAFEDHFFACDECFEKLQAAERFLAGVRDAAERGLLRGGQPASAARAWPRWLLPAFAVSACAALALAAVSGWMFFAELPRLRRHLDQTAAELYTRQRAQAALEGQLGRGSAAEPNLPFVMLQATRDVQAPPNEVAVPPGAQRVVLWAELGPAGRFRTFRLQVYTADNKLVETLEDLKRNSYGAIALSLPAERLPPGDYLVKLAGEEPPPSSVVGEYRLRVRRP